MPAQRQRDKQLRAEHGTRVHEVSHAVLAQHYGVGVEKLEVYGTRGFCTWARDEWLALGAFERLVVLYSRRLASDYAGVPTRTMPTLRCC